MNHSNTSISILTYTALGHCKKTLAAILPTLDGAYLFLTANGNKEVSDYFDDFSSDNENVSVIHNTENEGFIEPNNFVFDTSDSEFHVLLNDDCIPPPDWLERLKAPFSDPLVAITGARGTCQTLDYRFYGFKGDAVDYLEASCMMVRRSLMTTPLFSDYLSFAFCEDADLSLRVRERGYKIVQADFSCHHVRNTTVRGVPGIQEILMMNMQTCQKRWAHYLRTRRF